MKLNNRWNQMLAAILCMLFLTGCKGGLSMVADSKETKGYSLPQSMIIVATERNRYQQVYTNQLWDVVLEDGTSFQTYLLEQVQTFLQNMKTMTLLAKDQSITLTSAEKDQVRRLSDTYFSGLSQDDIDYMNISLDDVITLYQEYYLANKVVNELTKELNLEVSDSEAKVISIQLIQLSDSETASQVYESVIAEGSDFAPLAKEHSTDPQTERQLGRGEVSKALEDAAFSLTPGSISPVIVSDGTHYIIKCINDYDQAATQERKTQIYNERKNQVFQQIYSQFQVEHEIVFSDDIWQKIDFSPDDKTTTTNFFTLYQKEFGGQGY